MEWKISYEPDGFGLLRSQARTTTARRPDRKISDGTKVDADGQTVIKGRAIEIPWTCSVTGDDEHDVKIKIRAEIARMENAVIPNYRAPTRRAVVPAIPDETLDS
jgi:hypothetical protein